MGPLAEGIGDIDVPTYRTFVRGLGSLSGVTPAMAQASGVDTGRAVRVTSPGELVGTLVLREWASPAKSSRMVVYLVSGGRLVSFSVWRGSRTYRDVVSTRLGSSVRCSFVPSGRGRVVCQGAAPLHDPEEAGL